MKPLLVLDVVGLTPALLHHAPRMASLVRQGYMLPMTPSLPAVTCTAQTTMVTGLPPSKHGIVGNGWWDAERAEVAFWKQSARLVRGERVWDSLRREVPTATAASLFWWYAMYGTHAVSVTPRPAYAADGRKFPDCWTHPPELRARLQADLGTFPLFSFWGPRADITSTLWIAAAAKRVLGWYRPTLQLVYLPHLDYPLQKFGPDHPSIPGAVAAVDAVAGDLIDVHRAAGYGVMIVSEYGIVEVADAVYPNRVLRDAGLCTFRDDATGETLDHGASAAFAVPDHQIAHVHVRDATARAAAREALAATPGIAHVFDRFERVEIGLDHERAGDLVILSSRDRWFAHDWWRDDADAPDYQRTVDIHRKPGYDPRELFLDPHRPMIDLQAAMKLALRKLGFRTLMDVIPLDATLVRGSHGLLPEKPEEGPLLISDDPDVTPARPHQESVRDLILRRILGPD